MPREPLPQSASDNSPAAVRPEDPDTVKLTLVAADRSAEPSPEPEAWHLPGVIVHHIDALRSRGADDEMLELVTVELRKITGVRSRRSLRGA